MTESSAESRISTSEDDGLEPAEDASIEGIVGALDARPAGDGYRACCPAHDDENPSLSIRLSGKKILLHCFAGCESAEIWAALGYSAPKTRGRTYEVVYSYSREDGSCAYEVCRSRGKKFTQRIPLSGGRYDYKLGNVRRVPYRLPKLVAAIAGARLVFITEGEKDAENVARLGLDATTFSGGAGGWRPEYATFFEDADVVLTPDKDAAGKRFARQVAEGLAGHAKRVRILELPGLAEKEDITDWIVRGGNASLLLELVELAPVFAGDSRVASTKAPYAVNDAGHICVVKSGELEPLCNFDARIVQQLSRDDGANEPARHFVIESSVTAHRITIVAKEFDSLDWITDRLGARAMIRPGRDTKVHLAHAIKFLSQETLVDTVRYAHLGWRKIGEHFLFLSAGGAIGRDGAVSGIEVDLDSDLTRFVLPDPISDLRGAVGASLDLLHRLPAHIGYVLFAAVYRAPLAHFVPVRFSVFLFGRTGTRKSALCSVVQSHFGAELATGSLPANFTSTANAIERTAHGAKDVVLTVDDLPKGGAGSEAQRLNRTADQVLRGQGNAAGRRRMRPDGTLRVEMHPRGLILANGEDVPTGHSLTARMIVIEIGVDDVDNRQLSTLQASAASGLLAQSMSGYIRWLAARTDELPGLVEHQNAIRESLAASHARTPDNVAQLTIGLEQGLRFAREAKALTQRDYEHHLSTGRSALASQIEVQERHANDENPVDHFVDLLRAAVSAGDAFLYDAATQSKPPGAKFLGWLPVSVGGGDDRRIDWRPQGKSIGWIDGDDLYLEPLTAYRIASDAAQRSGRPLAVKDKTLWKRLSEAGLLLTHKAGRNLAQKTVGGLRRNVLHTSTERILGFAAEDLRLADDEPY